MKSITCMMRLYMLQHIIIIILFFMNYSYALGDSSDLSSNTSANNSPSAVPVLTEKEANEENEKALRCCTT